MEDNHHLIEIFLRMIHKCRKCRDMVGALYVYSQICISNMESSSILGNYVVPMFVDCGNLQLALDVFNRLSSRNVFSWTYLILGHIHSEQLHAVFELYTRMKVEGVQPKSYTLVALLKACSRLLDIDKGRWIHLEIMQKGFEADILVSNTLTDMYAKCGLPHEAQRTFESSNLNDRDAVIWNVLISGFVDHGFYNEALKCYDKMEGDGVPPSAPTFVYVLQACKNLEDISRAQGFHTAIVLKGFDSDCLVSNTLVDTYGRCGFLLDASYLFEGLSIQNVVSWTALIDGYAENDGDKKALELFGRMQSKNVLPNMVTFGSLLKACTNLCNLDRGCIIHSEIIHLGYDKSQLISNSLMRMYVKCDAILEAEKVFDAIPSRNIVSWNILFEARNNHGKTEEIIHCLDKMQEEGISPDVVAYACILKVCRGLMDLDKIRGMHIDITERGFERESLVSTALIYSYAKCGSPTEAQEIFDRLPDPSIVEWNALIAGYSEHGYDQEFLECLKNLQKSNTYASAVTYIYIIRELGNRGFLRMGQELHGHIVQIGWDTDSFIGNSLVVMYAGCGLLSDAKKSFVKLLMKDIISWNAIITGYADSGSDREALNTFRQMQDVGVCEDAITYVSVLKSSGNLGAINSIRQMHKEILLKGYDLDAYLVATLIVSYAKCCSLASAENIFEKCYEHSVVLWNSMITGLGMNHEVHDAIGLFKAMKGKGLKPDAITFLCLFTACGRTSMLDIGQEFLNFMTKQYHYLQTSDHFSSIVDLLARSGFLNEAEKFLETLPCTGSDDT